MQGLREAVRLIGSADPGPMAWLGTCRPRLEPPRRGLLYPGGLQRSALNFRFGNASARRTSESRRDFWMTFSPKLFQVPITVIMTSFILVYKYTCCKV